MSIHYKVLSLCAAVGMTALSLLAATPAVAKSEPFVVTAQRVSDLPTQHVSYRDLNLALASDQVRLNRRVGSAVQQVCRIGDYQADRTLASRTHYLGCSDFAWSGARPQIAAAIDWAVKLAQAGNGAPVAASAAITVSAPNEG